MTSGIRVAITIAALVAAVWLVPSMAAPRGPSQAPAIGASAKPRLLVLLVVDQFRADYVDWYGAQWTSGLKRLLTTGAYFPRATVPYGISKTCAGHATIGTGAWPSTHGLIDNEWYDSRARAFVACTLDESARSIGLGNPDGTERHSATRLLAPTLAEELRRQAATPPRIVSMALKARAAISLGGRGGPGTIVFWEEDSGRWATSSGFAATAWPEVSTLIAERPATNARGQVWNRLLPADRYIGVDRAPGEPGTGFPRTLATPIGVPFAAVWDASPWADAYLGDMAAALADRVALGRRDATDLLAIGFSALDYVGHAYGPHSHEVQDMLLRLDVVLGRLLDTLDRTVGADQYVVALTSDHGVAPLPEQAGAASNGRPGRVSLNALGQAVDETLSVHFGNEPFIEAITGTYVHFLPGVMERIRANPTVSRAVQAAGEAVPGIDRVFWSWDLAATAPTADARLTAMRRSYVAGRSGDLAFQPEPNWVVASAGTNHGSDHPYDTEVPLVFAGAGVAVGRFTSPATLADVAPTLAAFAGITMPRADGRVLDAVRGPSDRRATSN